MASKGMNGVAIASVAIGSLFIYAAIKGYSVLQTAQLVISGKTPAGQTQTTAIGVPTGTASSGIAQSTPGSVSNPTAGEWSHDGVMKLWQQVGGSAGSANNAACHAIQESQGNASITSPNPDGGTNVGLFQLDTKGVGAGHTIAELQNPVTNARITVQATNDGQNWSEWSSPGC